MHDFQLYDLDQLSHLSTHIHIIFCLLHGLNHIISRSTLTFFDNYKNTITIFQFTYYSAHRNVNAARNILKRATT